jgi:hypothetical protein
VIAGIPARLVASIITRMMIALKRFAWLLRLFEIQHALRLFVKALLMNLSAQRNGFA